MPQSFDTRQLEAMTPRYKLLTLLILLAILPPLLWFGWTKYSAWKAEQERQRALTKYLGTLEIFYGNPPVQQPAPPMPLTAPPDVPGDPPTEVPSVQAPDEPRE